MQCGAVCVYPECGGGCASAPPAGAVRGVSLSLIGVSDGGTSTGWKTIGFNLDGKCTVPVSTNVCTLQTGASKATQDDGTGGIDNSYGENICPVVVSTSGAGACSSALQIVYVITDATDLHQRHAVQRPPAGRGRPLRERRRRGLTRPPAARPCDGRARLATAAAVALGLDRPRERGLHRGEAWESSRGFCSG